MSELKVINKPESSRVQDILRLALKRGFTGVVVFGFKDGRIHTLADWQCQTLEMIGALEAAKLQVWNGA